MRHRTLKIILREILALSFILSAAAKLVGADSFELYIFSFEFFSLGASFILARLVICMEFILGLWLMLNTHPKASAISALSVLGGFSAFLMALMLLGNRDSCHCFGEFVDLSPGQSLIKNGVLIALSLASMGEGLAPFKLPHKKLILSSIAVLSVAAVFIISLPDNFRYSSFSIDGFNQEQFNTAVSEGLVSSNLAQGEDLICFFSFSCNFCHMTAQKLGIMLRQGQFENADVHIIVGGDYEDFNASQQQFFEGTKMEYDTIDSIKSTSFVNITNGNLPVVVHMRDGQLIEQWTYRDLH